jgi:hypothetical protein
MSERIVTGVPTDRVASFCRMQKAAGATVCEGTATGDGKSDVRVVFPDAQSIEEHDAEASND